jgi:hypothetical protein
MLTINNYLVVSYAIEIISTHFAFRLGELPR